MAEDSEMRMSDQLYELTRLQAREVLDTFLKAEAEAFNKLEIDSIVLDYSQQSVVRALRYIAEEVGAGHLNEEQRNIWFARLGYYFGEALRRAKPALNWELGNLDYAFANHPVISGFGNDEEAPVITICKNIIMAVAEHLSPDTRIENGVRNWFEKEVAELR
jgi:hypothetical protein